jgi:hypothetical protein
MLINQVLVDSVLRTNYLTIILTVAKGEILTMPKITLIIAGDNSQ